MAIIASEEFIRRYLQYLKDPDSVQADTSELEARLEQTSDPIERLQIHAELAQVKDPRPRLEEDFLAHAKQWADENGIGAEAFLQEGVPKDVLRRAGMLAGRRGDGRAPVRPRRRRVSAEDVRAALPSRRKRFTSKELIEYSGGSPATVRKVLAELIDAGEVEELGPDPKHSGPGRAPTLYKKA
jgi:CRP-like cAMP-binding protein